MAYDDAEAFLLMVRIRRFEEAIIDAYRRGIMPGLAHLSIGQEAVAVGVCSALRQDDYIISTHRGHGHCIAKGAQMDRMMAEVLGKSTGYCGGRGGTMHIADIEHGNFGATAIVGASLGLAVGVALACRYQDQDRVVVAFTGEGAMNEGITSEAMNLAAIWKLPVVFVCENNQYGEYSFSQSMTAGTLVGRAESYGIPSVEVDGMSVRGVRQVVEAAVAQARKGGGPTFLECETYRFMGHHAGDTEKYRTKEEVDRWKERDPIILLQEQLLTEGSVTEDQLEHIRAGVEAEVRGALDYAFESPLPDPDEVEEFVYG